jgi:cyclopropane fatty-acyl-phospholipid synthase-like methyltransferase
MKNPPSGPKGSTRKGNWEFQDASAKLQALGIHHLGVPDDADAAVKLVAEDRDGRADRIAKLLQLEPHDVLLDLGSGMGFMAKRLAPTVQRVHCADISEVYLADCRQAVADLNNVECHLIPYADLTALKGKGVSKVLSTLLFIHFNFYDFVYYLRGIGEILNSGGLVFLDFNDGDRFDLHNKDDSFNSHLGLYRAHHVEWGFGFMQMNSLTTLRHLIPQLGFELLLVNPSRTAFTELLLRRV